VLTLTFNLFGPATDMQPLTTFLYEETGRVTHQ